MYFLIDGIVPGSNQMGETCTTEHHPGWHTLLATFQRTIHLSSTVLQHSMTTESEKQNLFRVGKWEGRKENNPKNMSLLTLAYPTRTHFLLERFFSKHPLGFSSLHASLASSTSSFCQDHRQGHNLACPRVHLNLSENKIFETNVVPLLPRIQNRILQQQRRWEVGRINLNRIYQRPSHRRRLHSIWYLPSGVRQHDACSPKEKNSKCWENTSIK